MHYLCSAFQRTALNSIELLATTGQLKSGDDGALYVAERHLLAPSVERDGRLPEWLGIGLQNRGQQFESATDLTKMPPASGIFY